MLTPSPKKNRVTKNKLETIIIRRAFHYHCYRSVSVDSGVSGCVGWQFLMNVVKTEREKFIYYFYVNNTTVMISDVFLREWFTSIDWTTSPDLCVSNNVPQNDTDTHTSRPTTAWLRPCFKLPFCDPITPILQSATSVFLFHHNLSSVFVLCEVSKQRIPDLVSH